MYTVHGVCRIMDVEERTVDHKPMQYLVLQPLDNAGSRFLIPTHNQAAMGKLRPIMTRQELEALLHSEQIRTATWISDENLRKQRYRELIASSDRVALLQMVRSIHLHKKEVLEAGRKLHLCDENFLRDAQRLLGFEFSVVLGIPQQDVAGYVLRAMEET